MTRHKRTALPTSPSGGRLSAAIKLRAGQFVYVVPAGRRGRQWCQVQSTRWGRSRLRVEMTDGDGRSFVYRFEPETMLRIRTRHPDTNSTEVDLARVLLTRCFPETPFRVHPATGDVVVTWTDGPAAHTVLTALASHGVAHLQCTRHISGPAYAAALIRQAREGQLDNPSRTRQLLDDPAAFTEDERMLGRQLHAFAASNDPATLSDLLHRMTLDTLAETAGLPRPAAIATCAHCAAPPAFKVRVEWTDRTALCCPTCLPRYGAGHEIRPL